MLTQDTYTSMVIEMNFDLLPGSNVTLGVSIGISKVLELIQPNSVALLALILRIDTMNIGCFIPGKVSHTKLPLETSLTTTPQYDIGSSLIESE